MHGVFQKLLESPTFWILTVFIVVTCLIPDYLWLTYSATYRPLKILRKNEEPPQSISCSDDESDCSSSQVVINANIIS